MWIATETFCRLNSTQKDGESEKVWFDFSIWAESLNICSKGKLILKSPLFLAREFFFRNWSITFENIELCKNPLAKVQTATFLLRFWCNFISFNLLICKDLRISGARRVTRESGGRASKEKCPQGPISVTRNLISSGNRNVISSSKSWQI